MDSAPARVLRLDNLIIGMRYLEKAKGECLIANAYLKKIFSLALTFNSLLSIVSVMGILVGFYSANYYWKPYPPYLIDGSFFWFAIFAAVLNIYLAVRIGRVKTGRLWFHHYVYGFVLFVLACALLLLFGSISFFGIFVGYGYSFAVNAGRFFVLGGLTLFIDDFADVSKRLTFVLRLVRSKVYKVRGAIRVVQGVLGFMSVYIFLCVIFSTSLLQGSNWTGNLVLAGTLLVTSLTSLGSVYTKMWRRSPFEQS